MLHTVSRSLVKSKLFHFVYCCYSARVHFLANAMCVYIHCHRCVIERKKKQLYTAISFAQLLQCNCECIPRWLQRDQTLPLSAKGVACKTKFSSSFSKYKYLHVIASLANVKSCVTVGMFGPYSLSGLPLRLTPEDTSPLQCFAGQLSQSQLPAVHPGTYVGCCYVYYQSINQIFLCVTCTHTTSQKRLMRHSER